MNIVRLPRTLLVRGRNAGMGNALGPLGSSSSQHKRTPKLVLQKSNASFRVTFRPPGAEDRSKNRTGYPQSFRSFRFFELPTEADAGTGSAEKQCFLSDHIQVL